jgi:hypothetical protein
MRYLGPHVGKAVSWIAIPVLNGDLNHLRLAADCLIKAQSTGQVSFHLKCR